jgi:hypothetical protein
MTGDDLAAWQRRCGIPHLEGGGARPAAIVFSLPRKLRGASPVDERTELLCAFHEVFLDLFVGHCLRQAEASVKLAEQLSAPLAAAAAQRALEVLTKLAKMGDGAPAAQARTRAFRPAFGFRLIT